MGNYVSRRSSSASAACRVILSDGRITEVDPGTSVAELMLEHPQQFVVALGSLLAGGKATPVPADQKLERGGDYLMLPMRPGKSGALSAGEGRRVLSRARSLLRSGSFPAASSSSSSSSSFSSRSGPLTKWALPDNGGLGRGGQRVHVNGEEGLKGRLDMMESSSPAFGEMPEFLSKQLSGRTWKPSLHTIEERTPQKKIPHWLF